MLEAHPQRKKVPVQERAFMMGNITAINGYRANRILLKQRFVQGGYRVCETEHFLIFTRDEAPKKIIVHWFSPGEIDADIGDYCMRELKPLGVLVQSQNFGEVFGAILFSLFPYDIQRALYLYGMNTLQRYHRLLMNGGSSSSSSYSTMKTFATIYRRVYELRTGESFLDVGCSFGFLPLLISEHCSSLKQVVGVDILTDPFPVVRAISEERHLKNVRFVQANVLAEDFSVLGCFDTVVALHVLEHFAEADMYRALLNLLKVTSHRLIIAVPYEDNEPEVIYGHEQLFSRTKLEAVGNWCLHQLGNDSRMWCEDCVGGLLLIEKEISKSGHKTVQ